VLVPPIGYLERLRTICDRHGLLLIFDEVITGFGRVGSSFACTRSGVIPDIICLAKGLTNGAVPMGAVTVRSAIYRTVVDAAAENTIELYHGYTYSGHPLAAAAALATLALYQDEQLFERAAQLESYFEDAVHSLRESPYVVDIRNMGMVAAVELEPVPGRPTARAFEVFRRCYQEGILVRATGDTIALSPPLIISKSQIDELVSVLARVLRQLASI
jgi:beta-alanine--pyruvate transaminase